MNAKRLILNMDWGDNALACLQKEGVPYTEERLGRSVQSWASAGFTDVLWRVSCLGRVNQHSAVERVSSMADARWNPGFRPFIEMVERYDPLAVGIRACREHGLRVYAWLDMFDEYWPGRQGRVIDLYPEMRFVDRSGLFYFAGVPNYAHPEVRDFKLRHIAEISEYGADGIFLSSRSHSNHWSPFHQRGMYGYNAPVTKAYQSRSGVDLTDLQAWSCQGWPVNHINYTGEAEDSQLLYQIQGEFHTQYLSEVKALLRRSGQELMVDLGMDCCGGVPPIGLAPFTYEVDRWFDEGIVDGILPLTTLPGGWERETYDDIEEHFAKAATYAVGNKAHVNVWINVNPSKYSGFDALKRMVNDFASAPSSALIQGYAFHEASTFEWGVR